MSSERTALLGSKPGGREEQWRFTPIERLAPLWDVASDPAAVKVSVETSQGETPVETITVLGTGADRTGLITHRIQVAQHEQRTVLVHHRGEATYALDLEVAVAPGAHLQLVILHDGGPAAIVQETVNVHVGRDAVVKGVVCSLGGGVVREVTNVSYDGPGGDFSWHALAVAGAGQHIEHRQLVEHTEPHCRSRVVSRAVLAAADARTVWVGDVFIRHAAVATDTHEDNRNLVLTEGARADAVPNLEIETGDVVHAGHASATGRFDELQMFYLQSRGIPADQARRLVVGGFLGQVVHQIPDALSPVRQHVIDRLEEITGGSAG